MVRVQGLWTAKLHEDDAANCLAFSRGHSAVWDSCSVGSPCKRKRVTASPKLLHYAKFEGLIRYYVHAGFIWSINPSGKPTARPA